MGLAIGIIGLPNVGKSTIINALAGVGAEASNYPFCTIDCNQGVVAVPDGRLETLEGLLHPEEVIPSAIRFIDIAGLVEGASRGEGLGNKFLHHVRESDLLAHVLRCFDDPNVSHVLKDVNPSHDLDIVDTELFLADIERVEKWLEKERHKAKAVKKDDRRELEFLEKILDTLSHQRRIDSDGLKDYEQELLDELRLLTMKKQVLILNAGEEDPQGKSAVLNMLRERFGEENTFVVSAKLEAEIAALQEEDREIFMKELGIDARAKDRFIEKCHDLLDLVRYYTTAHEKLQAWSIPCGTKAPEAAGRIHSDMESGFIRAEVMNYRDLVALGSRAEVQHHGFLRTEGHDYTVQDGDVIHFLFQQ